MNCLIAFTNSRFNKDISLNAIGFLRFCAAKLAEGDLGKGTSGKVPPSSPHKGKDEKSDNGEAVDKVDHLYLWFPLLAGKATTSCIMLVTHKLISIQARFFLNSCLI